MKKILLETLTCAVVCTCFATSCSKSSNSSKASTGSAYTYDTTYPVSVYTGMLLFPAYVAIDGNGNLFVSESLGVVVEITPNGTITNFDSFLDPTGVVADGSGHIYVASNMGNGMIGYIEGLGGGIVRGIGNGTGFVNGLVLDANNNLFAANTTANEIDEITPNGTLTVFASKVPHVGGLALGADGSLYATSTTDSNSLTAGSVLKFSPSGTVTTVANSLPFNGQVGIAIDRNNNLYLTCYNPNSPTSYVIEVKNAGAGAVSAANNIVLTTNVLVPRGIAIDQAGNLYVVNVGTVNEGSISKLTLH